jgi:hypothetical protein
VESGRVQDVIYAGVLTRYVVDLDGGGELVVSRQNTEAPVLRHAREGRARAGRARAGRARAGSTSEDSTSEGSASVGRGDRVRIAWRTEQAFMIPQEPTQGPNSGEGNR